MKVLDFGVSKMAGANQQALTRTTGLLGSPFYMSPEQLDSARSVDARTDVWALAVTLFELLTATQPFPGESMPQLVMSICMAEPIDLRTLRPELPEGLMFAIRRALTKDPAQRTPDVASFAADIAPFGAPDATVWAQRVRRVFERSGALAPVATSRVALAPPPNPRLHATTGGLGSLTGEVPQRASGRRSVALPATGALLLLGGVAARVFATRASRPGPAAEPALVKPRDSATIDGARRELVREAREPARVEDETGCDHHSNRSRDEDHDEGVCVSETAQGRGRHPHRIGASVVGGGSQ